MLKLSKAQQRGSAVSKMSSTYRPRFPFSHEALSTPLQSTDLKHAMLDRTIAEEDAATKIKPTPHEHKAVRLARQCMCWFFASGEDSALSDLFTAVDNVGS